MRLKLHTIVFILVLSGCVSSIPASHDTEASYRDNFIPTPGYGRIYIINPPNNDLIGANTVRGTVLVGSNADNLVKIAFIDSESFLAFDSKPGELFIRYRPIANSMDCEEKIDIKEGNTLVLQPVMIGNGGEFGLIGLVIVGSSHPEQPTFSSLNKDSLPSLVRDKKLASINLNSYVIQK